MGLPFVLGALFVLAIVWEGASKLKNWAAGAIARDSAGISQHPESSTSSKQPASADDDSIDKIDSYGKDDLPDRHDISTSEQVESDQSNHARISAESEADNDSLNAHYDAIEREPPVEVGEQYRVLLQEENATSGVYREFKARYEGFWIFVTAHTDDVRVDDVVSVKITSISEEGNAAQAKYVVHAD